MLFEPVGEFTCMQRVRVRASTRQSTQHVYTPMRRMADAATSGVVGSTNRSWPMIYSNTDRELVT
jgi:hypothetical protein